MEFVRATGSNDIQGMLLREAAADGDKDAVRLLLERGANVSDKDDDGETALHIAAVQGHESIARLLLEQGADISALDNEKRTALHRATSMEHNSIVKLLIEKKAPLSTMDNQKRTPLHIAVFRGYEAIASLLLAQGAETDAETDHGFRALDIAAQEGHLSIAKLLLAYRATVDAPSGIVRFTALHHAIFYTHEKIARLLLENGADVNAETDCGYTPLFTAIFRGKIRLVDLLLMYGADKHFKLPDGRTALECAEDGSSISILLKDHQLLQGPVLRKTDDVRLPETPARFAHIPTAPSEKDQNDELKACKGFEAIIVDFFLEEGREKRVERRASIFELLYGRGPQAIMSEVKEKNLEGVREKFRWFHLPANNMEWIEVLVSRLFAEYMSGAALLEDEFKSNLGLTNSAGQQYRISTVHSSFMRPMARSIKPGVNSSLGDSQADQFMLFMPFLHYETESGYERMERAISTMKKNPQYYRTLSENPNGPTYTRMARRWLSIETLRELRIDHQIDQEDPDFILIKRWVPEYEQDFLWNHTRELRERRGLKREISLETMEKKKADPEEQASRRRKRGSSSSNKDIEVEEAAERRRSFRQVMTYFKEKARSKIQIDKHQHDKGSPRTGHAAEVGAHWEFGSIKAEKTISSENGGRNSLETREKGKEDDQADATSIIEDLQGKATTDVEAGPSSTQKGSPSPLRERSPGPPLPSSTIEVDRNQDIEGTDTVEYALPNDSADPNPPGPSSEDLREDDRPKAEDKGKKAEEDAPKPGGAAGMRRIRRNVTWTGRSTSPRFERIGAETIGVERARSKRGTSRSRSRSRRSYTRKSSGIGGSPRRGFRGRNSSPKPLTSEELPMTVDDLNNHLIKGYLYRSVNWKLPPLQPRRTLDEYFYTHLESTLKRDQDQVVYRFTKYPQPKIFMVDQLWLWILNEDTVISCCPQRWDSWEPSLTKDGRGLVALKDDPLSVIHSILKYLKNPTRASIESAYDLAFTITSACTSVFDQYSVPDEFQFLDFFERSLGVVMDREAQCFSHFALNLKQLKVNASSKNNTESDALFDISIETELLTEVKDIRDELNILYTMLSDQLAVLKEMERLIRKIQSVRGVVNKLDEKQIAQHYRVCKSHIRRVINMDLVAERTYDALNHLLDLKQKQTNASEARSARKQAENTAKQAKQSRKQTASLVHQAKLAALQAKETDKQGKTVLVFTVVTIIFLPLSFIAAFFAINIGELQHDDNGQLPMAYVLKYMISISAAISIPFILLAFNQDRVAAVLKPLLSNTIALIRAAPYLLAIWSLHLFSAVLSTLIVAVDHFNRRRRKKTKRGSQDDQDDLKKVEEGNTEDKSAQSRQTASTHKVGKEPPHRLRVEETLEIGHRRVDVRSKGSKLERLKKKTDRKIKDLRSQLLRSSSSDGGDSSSDSYDSSSDSYHSSSDSDDNSLADD